MEFWSPRQFRLEGSRGPSPIQEAPLRRLLLRRPVGRACTRATFAAPGRILEAAVTAPNARSAPAPLLIDLSLLTDYWTTQISHHEFIKIVIISLMAGIFLFFFG
jgi:hypothetical protein